MNPVVSAHKALTNEFLFFIWLLHANPDKDTKEMPQTSSVVDSLLVSHPVGVLQDCHKE